MRLVGVSITHDKDVFVQEFAHGGMSSGYISMTFWRECGLPTLIENFENHVTKVMGRDGCHDSESGVGCSWRN